MKKFLLLLLFLQGVLMSGVIESIKINGVDIPIIFEKDTSLPIGEFQFVFKDSGSIEDGDLEGIAKMSASLLNEGTKKLGSVKFAQKLENEAISLNFGVGKETFVINVSCLKDKIEKAIEALNDVLKDPNYAEKTLQKLKIIRVGEIAKKENNYDYIASRNLKRLIFKGTPLAKTAIGTKESIAKMELKDIENFIKKHLVLKRAIIVAGGDLTIEEVKKLSKKALSSLEKGEKRDVPHYEPIKKADKVVTHIKDIKQAYIYFASPYNVKYSDEDVYKAIVANFILGSGGFGSRLMEEIRVKRGLAYSAYSRASINKSYNIFTGYMQTSTKNQDEAIKRIEEIIREFLKKGVTEKELEEAKKFILGSEPLRNETLNQRLSIAFEEYYKGFKLGHTKEVLKKIKALKLEELNSFIKKHNEILNLSFSIVTK